MSVLDDFAEEEVVENPTLRAAYNAEPLHQNEPLHWDYEVNLIGEKIYDKTIHLCELCELPILVYGRMLPCKHVFCFDCARKCDKVCARCNYKVQKMEKSALGTVYVCTHGAPKHSFKGCRRTYLSQRDLHSHHAHRHLPKTTSSKQPAVQPGITVSAPVQPVPNQLPMTQQQAQQQATQQKQQQIGIGQSQMTSRGLLSSSQGQPLPMPPQMGSAMMMTSNSVQSSPLIPGLGGLGGVVTSQTPPHLQTSISPKPSLPQQQSQGLNMSYPGQATQHNPPDVYRHLDLDNLLPSNLQQQPPPSHRQLHQPPQQQQQGLRVTPGTQLQQAMPVNQPPFGQPTHFQHTPPPNQLSQQMGVSPVPQTLLSPGIHMGQQQQQHHQHQQQGQQQRHLETFSPQNPPPNVSSSPMSMPMASASQSRTNNLITVPIQDEGQYRPLPYVNTSVMNQPSAATQVSSFNNTQSRANSGGAFTQSFAPHGGGMSAGFPPNHGGGGGGGAQAQGMMGLGAEDQNQGLAFNQGPGNFNSGDTHRPVMGVNFNQPGGQVPPPRLGFNQPGMQQSHPPGMQPYPQGLRMNPIPRMGRGNNNNMRGLVQAISMVAAASRPHNVSVGAGMMPPGPGLNTQSGTGNNRFPGPPSGRWPSHQGMPPRIGNNHGQQRPHDGGNFNQGPYFNG
ncbi:E3 ubiquitin-protein ligase Hakai [Elysia marginata]|uniref:E3 ubiquitin-protein ligase Hakai n=1 Tax=Elysia marginata TaxID=1093978 RepID=A0AAV4E8C9_9GAST|nr:E3 ubiquitin-protein ligase Hakai [Elysia marginata]